MPRFLLYLAAFTLALAAIIYLLSAQFGPHIIHPYSARVLLLLAVLTGGTYYLTARVTAVKQDYFIAAYFGGVVLRFLGSILVLGIYLYRAGGVHNQGTISLLIAFFILYFLYAGFEIWAILSNLRPFSK
ncbi:hypothetical protein AUC43_03685 [Hymenobacter sedentarius]|uniref:Uncharacterized protein n=1 Tax=Hymenobacter sedentarius TaxID=1411621 RepID=A0A0U3SDR6_9BACT|nr:hypothetical protein [Hymenobacter sedentarius]ALW84278.1 hypothetical protein AUC43_03685 [Hymenobacter sedentarius]